ncbi:hypothetical protein CsatB_010030 [Cannabis sativa]
MVLQRNKKVSFLVVLLAISVATVNCQTFDVTKYGAKPNGQIDQALADAWKEACAAPSKATIVVPKGTYNLNKAFFLGPCKSPVVFQMDGILMAPSAAKGFKDGEGWVTFEKLQHLTITGTGTFDGNGGQSWGKKCKRTDYCEQLPINIRLNFITDSVIEGITTKDSKQFHFTVLEGENLLFTNLKIIAPEESWTTDGIHLGRSTNITITDTTIATGDDCISIGDGTKQLKITKVTCGPGHGISVGSLGKYQNELPVEDITVTDCTFKGTSNGVRIKTWQGSTDGVAKGMHFEKLTMDNPSKIKVSDVVFKDIKGTSSTPKVLYLVCGAYPCEGIQLNNIDLKTTGSKIKGPAKSVCTNVKPEMSGTVNLPPCTTDDSA